MLNQFFVSELNLINNANVIKQNNPNSLICAMVKANAYGVGLKMVVKTLSSHVDFFGVATYEEACKTANYTNKKILIVGPLCKKRKYSTRFSYSCHSVKDIITLSKLNLGLNVHLKINSGMNRYGFSSKKDLYQALNIIKKSKLHLEGVFTHFATTDHFVEEQMKVFKKFTNLIKEFGYKPIIHVDNSAVCKIKNHHKDMVRIGFDLYNNTTNNFKQVVTIKSRVVQVNEVKRGDLVGYSYRHVSECNKKIAVIPVGYADGFSCLYIGGYLKINNYKCKVLNVCMDCFMLDITGTDIKKGDAIFILDESNSLSTYSKFSNLSEYEVMCKFSHIRASHKLVSIS